MLLKSLNTYRPIIYAVIYIFLVKSVAGNHIANTNTDATNTYKRLDTLTITEY